MNPALWITAVLRDVLLSWLFSLFEGPSTQLPDKSYIETYSYLLMPGFSLVYFLVAFLKLSRLPFASGLFPFLLYILFSLLLLGWVGDWAAGQLAPEVLHSLFSHFFSLLQFSFYLFSLPVSPAYPCFCLAIGHLALFETGKESQASQS